MTAAADIAAAVEAACDVDIAVPYRPNRIAGRMAYVEPADPWMSQSETYCGISYGLDVYIIAGITDQTEAVVWLQEQAEAVMSLGTIDVGTDEVIPGPVGPPFQFIQNAGQQTFLACRIELSRFTIGD